MSSTVTYKGSTLTIVNNTTRTLLTSGKWMEADLVITDVTSGGSVTITDEANATGTTCVITTGQTPTPTPTPSGDIPLNTQLIDYTTGKSGYLIDGDNGEEVANEAGFVSDYTEIDPTMTFTYAGYRWWDSAFYDSSKTYISGFRNDAYADTTDENDASHGTLTPARIPSNAKYIRITTYVVMADSSGLSLIRIA